jgi:flagellar hook-length control protein FliK
MQPDPSTGTQNERSRTVVNRPDIFSILPAKPKQDIFSPSPNLDSGDRKFQDTFDSAIKNSRPVQEKSPASTVSSKQSTSPPTGEPKQDSESSKATITAPNQVNGAQSVDSVPSDNKLRGGEPAIQKQDRDRVVKALESVGLDEKQINALLSILDQNGHPEVQGLLQALVQKLDNNSKILANTETQPQALQQILGNLGKQELRAMDFLTQAGLTEAEAKNLIGKLQALKESSAQKIVQQAEQQGLSVENQSNKADGKTGSKVTGIKPGFLSQFDSPENRQGQDLTQKPLSLKPSAIKSLQSPLDEFVSDVKPGMKDITAEIKPGNVLLQSTGPVSAGLQKALATGGQKPPQVETLVQQANAAAENPAKIVETFRSPGAEVLSTRTTQASRIIHQIINQANFKPGAGQNKIQIRLDPPSLGTVRINVSTAGDSIRTLIVTENQSVKQVIESNFQQLRDSIGGQGLKVDSFSVLVGGNQEQAWQNGRSFSQDQTLPVNLNQEESADHVADLNIAPYAPRFFSPGQNSISVMA